METSIMYLLSFLAAPLLIAAFAVLFVKTHSPWLLAAAILETLSLLFRIALNAFNDRSRRGATRADGAHLSLDDGIVDLPSSDVPHEKRIADQQELALIRETILQLPERCRQIYLLNRIEGLSYTQIARHCGISVKVVEKQITKALATLRERVDKKAARAAETT